MWIQYYSWARRFHREFDDDTANRSGSYVDACDDTPLNVDGQLILDEKAFDNVTPLVANQHRHPPKIGDFGHELWDIARAPEPRCLWSSFWTSPAHLPVRKVLRSILAKTYVFPVVISARDYCNGFILPKAKPILIGGGFVHYDDPCWRIRGHCVTESCLRPIRFFQTVSPSSIIDVLHFEQLLFHGRTEMSDAQLSRDFSYLGAIHIEPQIGKPSEGTVACILVLWSVKLPRPQLLWDDGVTGLCSKCDWIIDKDWLVVHCIYHGTVVYSLKSSAPDPISITNLVCAHPFSVICVCGVHNNVLVFDGLESPDFTIVKLTQTLSSKWVAEPIQLSTQYRNFTVNESIRLHIETTNYIRFLGRRYMASCTGDLFDVDTMGCTGPKRVTKTSVASRPMKIADPLSYAHDYDIVALHEVSTENAIAACCSRDGVSSWLKLVLFTSGTKRELRPYKKSTRLPSVAVHFVTFSPDGRAAFIAPTDYAKDGWIITFRPCCMTLDPSKISDAQYDYRVLEVPTLPQLTENSGNYLRHPTFLSNDMVVIVWRGIRGDIRSRKDGGLWLHFDVHLRHTPLLRFSDDHVEPLSNLGDTLIENVDELGGLPPEIKDRAKKSYKRWVNVLQESPRNSCYGQSIHWSGTRVAISPGQRFLLYAADRMPEISAVPHVEMRDLAKPAPSRFTPVRRSTASLTYCLRLRRDYLRPVEALDTSGSG